MALLFGQGGDLVEEVDSGHEVLHGPGSRDPFCIRVERPALEALESSVSASSRESGGTPPSQGMQRFLRKLVLGGRVHPGVPPVGGRGSTARR